MSVAPLSLQQPVAYLKAITLLPVTFVWTTKIHFCWPFLIGLVFMALTVLTGLVWNAFSHELFLLVLRSECSTSDKALMP